MRAALGLADKDFVALTVGKLSERKRVRDVLEAARMLKAECRARGIWFLLAGNGPLLDELSSVADAENLPVKLLGFINVDRLPKIYAAADLIIHPSSRDPHPLVLSEAACIGLPLIVSDRVGAAGPTDIARPARMPSLYPAATSRSWPMQYANSRTTKARVGAWVPIHEGSLMTSTWSAAWRVP